MRYQFHKKSATGVNAAKFVDDKKFQTFKLGLMSVNLQGGEYMQLVSRCIAAFYAPFTVRHQAI